jgi:hypothetical protein
MPPLSYRAIFKRGKTCICRKNVLFFAMQDNDGLQMARYFNCLAQIIFVAIVLTFNIIFWSVACSHYLADPETFLDLPLF